MTRRASAPAQTQRVPLPGGGWADRETLAAGLLNDSPAPQPVEQGRQLAPNEESLGAGQGRIRCGCPRHVIDGTVVLLSHHPDCVARHPNLAVPPPPLPKRPPGASPCPKCGNVAHSLLPDGRRRCDGPRRCGHAWKPGERSGRPEPARSAAQTTEDEMEARAVSQPRQRALALLSADPEG